MSADLHAFAERLREERLRYAGLPAESRAQIIEEAAGKLLALPEDQAAVGAVVGAADTAAGMLANVLLPGSGPVAAKVLDVVLHATISYLERKYRDAEARGR